MAIPSKKSPEMTRLLNQMFDREKNIQNDMCVGCGHEAKIFRNKISEKEFTISGYCQNCQDKVFGKD